MKIFKLLFFTVFCLAFLGLFAHAQAAQEWGRGSRSTALRLSYRLGVSPFFLPASRTLNIRGLSPRPHPAPQKYFFRLTPVR